RLRSDLDSTNRSRGIRGLMRVASLNPASAPGAAAILNREFDRRRLDRRNVGLVLTHNTRELDLPAASAPKRTQNLDRLIDPIR
ncbi:MAG: hypothetical protein ABIO78_09890, partial [Thermoanaerobaculia bacterium]